MADDTANKPYPFQFDPSQWANPYTAYNKMALPFMGQYAGTPTDAHGNPIQSYQDAAAARAAAPPPQAAPVTLNTSPQISSAFSPDQAARILQGTGQWGINSTGGQGGAGGGVNNQNALDRQASLSAGYQPQAAQPTAAPAAAPGGGGAIDMNAAYLAALANPGHVSTLGATVPQSAPPSNQSGVLQQFLQNWQPGSNPAGNYNPSLFPNALRGQV